MACDYWINSKLVEDNKLDKFATMTGELAIGCYDEQYDNMSVPEIFNALLQKKNKKVVEDKGSTTTIGKEQKNYPTRSRRN